MSIVFFWHLSSHHGFVEATSLVDSRNGKQKILACEDPGSPV